LAKGRVDYYDIYRGSLGDHVIESDLKGNKRYYMTRNTLNEDSHAASTGFAKSANGFITGF